MEAKKYVVCATERVCRVRYVLEGHGSKVSKTYVVRYVLEDHGIQGFPIQQQLLVALGQVSESRSEVFAACSCLSRSNCWALPRLPPSIGSSFELRRCIECRSRQGSLGKRSPDGEPGKACVAHGLPIAVLAAGPRSSLSNVFQRGWLFRDLQVHHDTAPHQLLRRQRQPLTSTGTSTGGGTFCIIR
eukprot:3580072-Rhodomonas_salina.3